MSSALFTPITIRNLSIRNRIWVSPLCQYSISERDGVPIDWQLVHLGSFARGGAGLVMTEATAVSPEGRISSADTGIWNDEQAQAWVRIVDFIHSQGAAAGIQLAHAGRKASVYPEWSSTLDGTAPLDDGGWVTFGPSAVAFPGYGLPEALDDAGIEKVVADFVASARRSVDAGFDVLELHGAHGYLLHQFLSPLSNQRTDQYGGSLENRARLVLRIIREIRAEVGEETVLFVRFSGTDYAEGGWTVEETAIVAGWSKDAGADNFDISSGGNITGVRIPVGPGYQVPFAEQVRDEASVSVNAVGMITDAHQAEQIVASGQADAVMIGREFMRDPNFPLHAAAALGEEIDYWPKQYLRAKPRS
jgi:2,4-dienoyl-CoA reductase-like NADH-dependent reductase (Old Yellow Enzyme family)